MIGLVGTQGWEKVEIAIIGEVVQTVGQTAQGIPPGSVGVGGPDRAAKRGKVTGVHCIQCDILLIIHLVYIFIFVVLIYLQKQKKLSQISIQVI